MPDFDDRTTRAPRDTVVTVRTGRTVCVEASTVPHALEMLARWLRDYDVNDFSVGAVTFRVHAERPQVDATAHLL